MSKQIQHIAFSLPAYFIALVYNACLFNAVYSFIECCLFLYLMLFVCIMLVFGLFCPSFLHCYHLYNALCLHATSLDY